MFAAVGTNPTLYQRVKPMIIAGFLALSLMVGAGAAAHQVGAAAPQLTAVTAQTGTGGAATDTTIGVAEKGKGGKAKTGKGATTAQPDVHCIHYSRNDWFLLSNYEEDPGPGGYTDCFFV